jgi:predicted metal-binding protein
LEQIERLFNALGCTDFKFINPKKIVTGQWVRMKCMFGCSDYGKNATCPPNVPSVSECRQFFDDYETGAIIHFAKEVDKPEDRFEWAQKINQKLLLLERDIFLSGFQKVFVLGIDNCGMCKECSGKRETCMNPKMARPMPEAMAIDVYSTVRKHGFPIQVLTDYSQTMNRYSFLLIE